MLGNYEPAEALVIIDEGREFTDNPADPGGPTKLGVTQRTLSAYLKRLATIDDVKALTEETVKPIYKNIHWNEVRGDECPAGVDYFLFDSAIQHGEGRAIRFLQKALGCDVDGIFGPGTMAELQAIDDRVGLIEHMRLIRLDFYRQCSGWPVFGNGWTNRLRRVAQTATTWARRH